MTWRLIQGDCRKVLASMEPESVHCCITDPPYEIGMMSAKWDKTRISYDVAMWSEVLRVLKPGGFLLAFSSCRTYHRMACAVEDAGFTIHPMFSILGWVQSKGMPKGRNVGKEVDRRTVKPVELMRRLVRLATRGDNDSLILDPFVGSGSTGIAVMLEQGRGFIGIDQDAHALEIADARIRYWAGTVEADLLDGVD